MPICYLPGAFAHLQINRPTNHGNLRNSFFPSAKKYGYMDQHSSQKRAKDVVTLLSLATWHTWARGGEGTGGEYPPGRPKKCSPVSQNFYFLLSPLRPQAAEIFAKIKKKGKKIAVFLTKSEIFAAKGGQKKNFPPRPPPPSGQTFFPPQRAKKPLPPKKNCPDPPPDGRPLAHVCNMVTWTEILSRIREG